MGMRLAGIDGLVLHERDEVVSAIEEAVKDRDLGILLITEKLIALCPEVVYERKLGHKRPLIVEVPDRHGGDHIASLLDQYISEAIGVKM